MATRDRNTTLTHVYGVIGGVLSIIGLIVAVKANEPWSTYALIASGWIASMFLAAMLVKAFDGAREDGEQIGKLTEQIASLQRDLEHRTKTLDYIAALQMGQPGTP